MTGNNRRVTISGSGRQNATIILRGNEGGHGSSVVDGGQTTRYANTAGKLADARQIAIRGEAVGEGMFDGSADVDIYVAVERITNTELEAMLV